MSNLASPRVLPPFSTASEISSSRAPWMALAMAPSSAARSAKVSAASAGRPMARAWAKPAARSWPSTRTWATTCSVAGLRSGMARPAPWNHWPAR